MSVAGPASTCTVCEAVLEPQLGLLGADGSYQGPYYRCGSCGTRHHTEHGAVVASPAAGGDDVGTGDVDVWMFTTDEVDEAVLADIRALMDLAFHGDFDDDDWAHTVGGTHFTVEQGGHVLAHAAVVERVIEVDGRPFRTGYVEGVATHPGFQGEGLGTAVMAAVGDHIRDGFELGVLGTDAHHFYERLGWARWQGPSHVRRGDRLVRSPDDDDGIMVLLSGPSATVDRAGSISCDARAGDDW